jgi:DNA-binding NtrC family response regulator
VENCRSAQILIVDDDRSIIASLVLLFKQAGYGTQIAFLPEGAWQRLSEGSISLVLLDLNFSRQTSGEEGLTFLGRIKARYPSLPVILMTAWGSISLAVRGIQSGAVDFIVKPWNNRQLLQTVKTALALADTSFSSASMDVPNREALDTLGDFHDIIGRDPKLLRILAIVGRISRTDASVLITGESGTGKELVAEAIHRHSERRDRPFLKVNLGGISASLFESEMFGHVRGAFTDAHQSRQGRFETADGGTIFLDEIGDLEPGSQVKLLRVLQDYTYEVLGSSRTRTVDVRIISATNRTLEEMERAMIDKALQHHAGNISRAAESLGMTRTSLYRRIEKYGIRF